MGDDDSIIPEDYDDPGDVYDRTIKMCKQKIIACFKTISTELDPNEAWQLFDRFVRASRTKYRSKRKKGVHDFDFNTALLAAYDSAPLGKKRKHTNAVGATHRKSPDATEKHLRRLLKTRKDVQRAIDFFCAEDAKAKKSADK